MRLAERAGGDVWFVATSPRIDGDDDLNARIDAHRAERPPSWTTIEETDDLAAAIGRAPLAATVVVDCLTVWVGTLVYRGVDDRRIRDASRAAVDAVRTRSGDTIVVSNEVGLGIVPAHAETRRYRDLLGHVNRQWVDVADRARFLVAGRALDLTELDAP